MNLNKAFTDFIGWNISVLKKLWINTATQFTCSVLFFGFSQLFMIVAMFLPLKVIILLSTDKVPDYLSSYMTEDNKQTVILGLVIAAFTLYFLFVLLEWLFKRFAYVGAEKLLIKAKKIDFFDNQNVVAGELYLRYSKMLGSILIVFIIFCAGFFANLTVFSFLAVLVFFQYFMVYYFYRSDLSIFNALSNWINGNLNIFLNIISSLNFLLVFLSLVFQYYFDPSFSILLSLVTIILSRQAMQRFHGILLDANYLALNRVKFNALFYSNIQYSISGGSQHDDFLDVVSHHKRNEWLAESINVITDSQYEPIRLEADWRDSGTASIGCFDVLIDANTCFTIKIFAANRKASCMHERLIYLEMGERLDILPKYYGGISIGSYEVSIYSFISQKMVGVPQWKATLNELLLVLWCTPPTDDLVSIYRRSKPLLQQRLTIDTVSPLVVATINQKEKSMIESLLTKIDQIVGKLNQSPLFVSNPEMVRVTVFLDENEQKLVNSWSRWTLEPVGALLPVPQDELAEQLASQIVEKHPVRLTVEQLIFNAYIYEFEKSLSRQNLREAMAFVPKIIDLLK